MSPMLEVYYVLHFAPAAWTSSRLQCLRISGVAEGDQHIQVQLFRKTEKRPPRHGAVQRHQA